MRSEIVGTDLDLLACWGVDGQALGGGHYPIDIGVESLAVGLLALPQHVNRGSGQLSAFPLAIMQDLEIDEVAGRQLLDVPDFVSSSHRGASFYCGKGIVA